MDGTSTLRCMAVALSEAQQDAVRVAIMPVELVRFRTVADACLAMSTVLPLIVAIDEALPESERNELADLAEVCGAEVVAIEEKPPLKELAYRMADALSRAERRRFKIA